MKINSDEYRSDDECLLAIDGFHGFCGMLLFEFARNNCEKKDIIIRNFIARTDMMVRGIMQLWGISDFQDCWILYRCLLDRLFHLYSIGENEQFDVFDDWSFIKQYEAQNRIRSDPSIENALDSELLTQTKEQKERYSSLCKDRPNWHRPKVKDVAKQMSCEIMYKYGYDYGSTHVHPMANDGQQDFFSITGLEPSPVFPQQLSVLSNSILTGTMIVQEGLKHSSFRWRVIVYDFLEQLINYLDTGDLEYGHILTKLVDAGPEFNLCEPSSGGDI